MSLKKLYLEAKKYVIRYRQYKMGTLRKFTQIFRSQIISRPNINSLDSNISSLKTGSSKTIKVQNTTEIGLNSEFSVDTEEMNDLEVKANFKDKRSRKLNIKKNITHIASAFERKHSLKENLSI